ncbi:YdcH family protein [Suttonella ornithocola]|uniref:Uncharacterized protein conserved in bacteria n=1 Tax=Suttonella ornithocola TaxID=279832 RepID=A0A380MT71_9GAMM|nr:DUF465 domain-containing protein [Suttonella ornithocola]SUO95780.1 Uncharacterized protein conserved in bacteria [Suttonella ornithocola]
MLHEYRELIAKLRQNDNHFARLFDEHNELDEEINRLLKDPVAVSRSAEIEEKKRKKLHLKDEIYRILKEKDAERNQ